MVAMQIALDAPQRVASVVTIGAPAQIAGNAVVNASLAALTWWMFRHDVAWMLDKGARQMRCSPAAKRYLLENGASMDKDELRRVWAGVVAFGVRSRLSEMQPPVLVIAGSRDANFRRARSAAAQMPNARFACIEGAGHITNRDVPARVNALIDEWLEREARDEVVRPDRQTDSHG
jgi:pimeloyl-ACP methyl ester carboxylesterase